MNATSGAAQAENDMPMSMKWIIAAEKGARSCPICGMVRAYEAPVKQTYKAWRKAIFRKEPGFISIYEICLSLASNLLPIGKSDIVARKLSAFSSRCL
jgi:hypothetical protein